jgi:hypothetical protein
MAAICLVLLVYVMFSNYMPAAISMSGYDWGLDDRYDVPYLGGLAMLVPFPYI